MVWVEFVESKAHSLLFVVEDWVEVAQKGIAEDHNLHRVDRLWKRKNANHAVCLAILTLCLLEIRFRRQLNDVLLKDEGDLFEMFLNLLAVARSLYQLTALILNNQTSVTRRHGTDPFEFEELVQVVGQSEEGCARVENGGCLHLEVHDVLAVVAEAK